MVIAELDPRPQPETHGLSTEIAEWTATCPAPSPRALAWARHALLDWLGVTIAGSREPLSAILRDELAQGTGSCTLIGAGASTDLHNAALINGTAGHALDYDDVAREMEGHPTSPVAPAVIALAEHIGASGAAVLDALIVGVEVENALGLMTQGAHYAAGFHATGTIGSLGAAMACARLLRLDTAQTAAALGIAASQAAALKCNFGTMVKPFHAGKAAANGLLAARLAAGGFTANPDAIEAPQGFMATQSPNFQPTPFRPNPTAPLWIERTLFKYHAACYSTHATIDAVGQLRRDHALQLADMAALTLTVSPRHLNVCNIPEPETGLQMKFSLRHLAAMALDGAATSALTTYSDTNANDPRYIAARRKVTVVAEPNRDRMVTHVEITLTDGRRLMAEVDVGQPANNLPDQWQRLATKFTAIAAPMVGPDRAADLTAQIGTIERTDDIHALMALAR
ncbi:MAG TPA: MmgE/PrpD family protein [Thermohalobaculum sp.]|nr:MmgE/PrpD family protein [Thermohalobaculum sp.]